MDNPIQNQEAPEDKTLQKVSQLIYVGKWMQSLVRKMFNPSTAEAILRIPIENIWLATDKMIWPLTLIGRLTMKAAYRFLEDLRLPPSL